MIENRYNIDLVKYLSYIFEWDKDDILSDVDYYATNSKGTVEGYTLAIYLMLKSLYRNNELYKDYIKVTEAELPYICGRLNIYKSVTTNSLINGLMWQEFNDLSINTPVNLSIKFCLDILTNHKSIRGTEFSKRIRRTVNAIFNTNKIYSADIEQILYFLNIIEVCLDSDYYENYYPVLKLCQLFLEQLYLTDGKLEDLSNSKLFEIDMPYIMQEFLRTALRHVMLRLNKTSPYEKDFKGNWSMRRKECHLGTSNINLDVLIKFVKTSSFPHLIFDSKTNKSVIESLKDNRYQLQTYVTEYNARHSNATGVVQYFMDENASKKDLSFNLTRLNSDIADLNMFVWVYQLKSDSDPKDFEDYLYNQLIDLLEL